MPAMPKEKTTAVSLSEKNFSELKLKESGTSGTAAMTTSATPIASIAAPNRMQHHSIQQRNTCGCGSSSAEDKMHRGKQLTNDHSSPLAAAVAASTEIPTSSFRNNGNRRTKFQIGTNLQQQANDGVATAKAATTCSAPTPPKKSPKDFIFGKYIGEGSFSMVYLAVDVRTKREYAIKVCEKRHILRENKQEYIQRERLVMDMLTNVPGFVNLSCTFQDNRSLYFVMTYAKNGDLLPYIHKVGSFDADCSRHYAAELVLACEQMHSRNVVHRDLKPENILLDEDMHTLIADFGSCKILTAEDRSNILAAMRGNPPSVRHPRLQSRSYIDDDDNDEDYDDDSNDTCSDELESPCGQRRYQRKRKGSFVGTAQYVSPEVLQNGPITPAADLWALGCILYQMISGLPPFRGSNDYVIFNEIVACNLDFPEGFDKNAEDLVRQLLKKSPEERLGAQDSNGYYNSIRAHPFFVGINFDSVRHQTPPSIYPYLPGVSKEDFHSQYRVPENLEPGLDDKQLTRLLGMELGTALESDHETDIETDEKTAPKNIFDLTDVEKQKRLEQQKSDKWHVFADNEVILKKGYVNKRKGLFARRRRLLLTTGPRLIYIDPVQMIKKGEIPWSPELRVEAKNFKIFFVHTPNRTYYLEDPEGYSLEWVAAIEKMHMLTYNKHESRTNEITSSHSTSALKTTAN